MCPSVGDGRYGVVVRRYGALLPRCDPMCAPDGHAAGRPDGAPTGGVRRLRRGTMQEERPLPAERAARCRPRLPELTETARDRAPPEPSAAGARRRRRARRRRLRVRARGAARRHPAAVARCSARHWPTTAAPSCWTWSRRCAGCASAVAGDERRRRDHPPALRAGHRHRGRADQGVLPVLPAGQHRRAAAPVARAARAAPGRARPAAPAHGAARRGLPRRRPRRGRRTCWPAPSCDRCSPRTPPSRRGSRCWRILRRVGRRAGPRRAATRSWPRWSTCCGRPTSCARASRPSPTRRSAIGWYMEQLGRNAVPDLLGEFEREVRAAGFTVPDRRPPGRAGLLGRRRPGRQPERHPGGHPRGRWSCTRTGRCASTTDLVEQLIDELSISTRVIGRVRGAARLAGPGPARAARGARPVHPAQRARALPAQALLRAGPPRGHAGADAGQGGPHVAGRRLPGRARLHRGPGVLDRSLRGHLGGRIADGTLARARRTARALGLHLAELDIREHSERHHAGARRGLRRARRAGQALRRADPRGAHARCWPRELDGGAHWSAATTGCRTARRTCSAIFDMLHDVQHEYGPEVAQHLHRLDVPGRRRPAGRRPCWPARRTWSSCSTNPRSSVDLVPLFETVEEL